MLNTVAFYFPDALFAAGISDRTIQVLLLLHPMRHFTAWLTEDVSCFRREEAGYRADLKVYTKGSRDDFLVLGFERRRFMQKEVT
jgi:hypothetical protein